MASKLLGLIVFFLYKLLSLLDLYINSTAFFTMVPVYHNALSMVILINGSTVSYLSLLVKIFLDHILTITFEVFIAIKPEAAFMVALGQHMKTANFVNQLPYNSSVDWVSQEYMLKKPRS